MASTIICTSRDHNEKSFDKVAKFHFNIGGVASNFNSSYEQYVGL